MTTAVQIELEIGSSFEELELVDLLMEVVAEQVGMSSNEASALTLAAREAAANAVQHGNRQQAGKRVRIKVILDLHSVILTVSDEGEGFDPSGLPDPLAPPNLLKPTGRGIFLMRSLMSDVDFEFPADGGTVVTMRRERAPDPGFEEE